MVPGLDASPAGHIPGVPPGKTPAHPPIPVPVLQELPPPFEKLNRMLPVLLPPTLPLPKPMFGKFPWENRVCGLKLQSASMISVPGVVPDGPSVATMLLLNRKLGQILPGSPITTSRSPISENSRTRTASETKILSVVDGLGGAAMARLESGKGLDGDSFESFPVRSSETIRQGCTSW